MSLVDFIFEWDPAKAKKNLSKHGISFEQAAQVFRDPHALSIVDIEHSRSDENRWITLGQIANGLICVVCHLIKDQNAAMLQIRIISARKATKRERLQYESAGTET